MTNQPALALSDDLLVRISDRLKALADPTRLKILLLLERDECCVSDLVEEVGGSQANVSKHLSVLKNAGIVKSRREGMNVCYSLEEPAVFEICLLTCGCLERQAAGMTAELERGVELPSPAS